MGKVITWYLGKGGSHLDQRAFELVKLEDGGATRTTLSSQTLSGTTEVVTVEVDDGLMLEVKLTDQCGGVDGKPTIWKGNSNDDVLPFPSGEVLVVGIEDESSSSSSSSQSSSSSSSSSSQSSSSSSSQSSSSSSSSSSESSSVSSSSSSSSSQT